MNMSHLAVRRMDIMYNIMDLVTLSSIAISCQSQTCLRDSSAVSATFCVSSGEVSVVFSIVVLGGAVVVDSVVFGASLNPHSCSITPTRTSCEATRRRFWHKTRASTHTCLSHSSLIQVYTHLIDSYRVSLSLVWLSNCEKLP